MSNKHLDVKIALLLICIITLQVWMSYPPNDGVADGVAGLLVGLAIYGIIRIW